MKFRSFLLPFLFVKNTTSEMIRNKNVPSCINCKFSNKGFLNSYTFLHCKKFGEKNIVTDKVNYDFADSCRNDEKKCGIEGKYYEEDKYLLMKRINYSESIFVSFICFYIFVMIILSNKIK